MTDKQVVEMLTTIKSYYQNFILNDNVANAWINIFKDYEAESINACLSKYVKTNEYCPVPASILKLYEEGRDKINKSIGKDCENLISILTFALGRADVMAEVNSYRRWIKSIPEISRMRVSRSTINDLKLHVSKHIGEEFDFLKWLKTKNNVGVTK